MPENKKNEETKKEVKKTKRTPKIRPIEELKEISSDAMTGPEAKTMVVYLKEQLILAKNREEALRENIETTRQKDQENVKKAEAMERFYRERLAFVHESARTLFDSIDLATKGMV